MASRAMVANRAVLFAVSLGAKVGFSSQFPQLLALVSRQCFALSNP